jgi:hypothetical protein
MVDRMRSMADEEECGGRVRQTERKEGRKAEDPERKEKKAKKLKKPKIRRRVTTTTMLHLPPLVACRVVS